MPFKSGKYWSSTFSKVLSGAALSVAALTPVSSGATITIVNAVASNGSTTLANNFNGTYYYPAFASPEAPFGLIDSPDGFSFVDLASDINPNSNFGSDAGQNPGVIYFNVQSSNTFTQAVAIAALVNENPSVGTTPQLVPIASQNQSICGASNSDCFFTAQRGGVNGQYFYAVPYTGGVLTVGINPKAICNSYSTGISGIGAAPAFCTSQLINGSATVTSSTVLTLSFVIYNQADLNALNNNTTATPPATQDTMTTPALLTFVNLPSAPVASPLPSPSPSPSSSSTPLAVCNLTAGSIANPLQSAIQIDGTQFSISGDPINATPGAVIATANLGTTVFDQASGALLYTTSPGNSVLSFAANPSGLFVFPGFQNSTPTQTFSYRIGFLARDYPGFVFDDGSGTNSGSCTFPGQYETSNIQGFLDQNKCFIATAAFRMGDEGPIRLLRQFRDHFLYKFAAGESFIRWYYAWSPGAANWLIDHPVFRYPVLLALIPLQVMAWMILHPLLLGLVALSSLGLSIALFLGAFAARSSSSKEGAL